MPTVTCPRCSAPNTAFWCTCGTDLRSLYPKVPTKGATTESAAAVVEVATVDEETKPTTVVDWLRSLDLGDHAESFVDNEICLEDLDGLTDDDLKELGVSKLGHRKTILRRAAEDAEASVEEEPAPIRPWVPPVAGYQYDEPAHHADRPVRNRGAAAALALLLGGFGVHRFYLNQPGWGLVYFLFCWTFIPAFASFFEALMIVLSPEERENAYGVKWD